MDRNRFWLLILILIGMAIRLTLLEKQSLWYDEGVTWMLSQMPLFDLIQWTAADIQPPLYYLLIWTTDIFLGDSEWALRFPSVIFGLLTIPLIFTLARRLFSTDSAAGTLAPLLAAALFTFSSLMIYYSQEARMYTLLVFEATLAGYLLLKILHFRPAEGRARVFHWPTAYAIVGAAALYTHYFAAFLLMAHAVYALLVLWQRRFQQRHFVPLLLAFGGSIILFLPWLPTLLARLGDDPSYWPGALKLNEVVRALLISFAVGETVFEQTGWWLALGYVVILLICSIWSFATMQTSKDHQPSGFEKNENRSGLQPLIFLWLWFLLPIILILILTYQSPKFNARYTLLAWPAFCLILAAVLTRLLKGSGGSRVTFYASRAFFVLALGFILATNLFSLTNWFADSRFAKDDFKALAQFVRERKADDETVLLSSGHMFPVWAYYYGWEGWTPLPWMLRLDVNQVTGLDIAADIAAAVEGHGGVWLVSWQDEVIDPNGVVPFWLDLVGERPVDAGDFWGVALEHWRLNPRRIDLLHQNPIKQPAQINFAGKIELIGFTQLSDTELALFWRPRQPLPDDLYLTLTLTDANGFNWSRKSIAGRPGSYLYPPSRWPVDKIMMTRYQLPWQIGTPPGLYIAEIELGEAGEEPTDGSTAQAAAFSGWDVLDEQGRPQRRTALLQHVNLSHLIRPEAAPLPPDDDPLVDFFPIIGLRRSILPVDEAQPGDRLLLALLWQAGNFNADDVSVAFDLIDSNGKIHRVGSSLTPSRRFNLPRWKPGDLVLGQYWLGIPPEAAPGPAALQLHLINVSGFPYDEVFTFDALDILPTERNFVLPDSVDMMLEADFSSLVTLTGADCPADCRAVAGQSSTLTLYWQANAPIDTSYTIFTHLLGPDDTVLINADHAPPKPTQGWIPGEIIVDPVTLSVPSDLPPGQYSIEVGLYDAGDAAFPRLPLTGGGTRVILPQPLVVEK